MWRIVDTVHVTGDVFLSYKLHRLFLYDVFHEFSTYRVELDIHIQQTTFRYRCFGTDKRKDPSIQRNKPQS